MIELKNVNKWYNKKKSNEIHVINDISLELPEKGMVAIFGKSGCGKTTLLNTIGGLDGINNGDIRIYGKSIKEDTDYLRNRHIGYIFQNYCLNRERTVYENVADALRLCGMTDETQIEGRVIAALDSVGMKKYIKRTPDALSGGQQQRVAIARAIVKSPSIILADEPTGNIDEKNTVAIMDMLKAISQNSLVLLVTHEAKLVDYYCDKVIELQDGKIKNIYENEKTSGYVGKDKNTIYLGELERSNDSFDGVEIEYYGEKTNNLKIRIIRTNGKLYIQSDDPNAKLIDGTGEIKIREGVYDQSVEKLHKQASIPALPSFEGSNYGKLFTLKNSIADAIKDNLTVKKSKVRTRLLKVSMFALAAVLVISSARFSVFIRDYLETMSNYNDSVLFLPVLSSMKGMDIREKAPESGIDYISIQGDVFGDNHVMEFSALDFMTASSVRLSASGNTVSPEIVKDCPLAAGTDIISNSSDMLITTAVADELINTSTVNIISDYKDLIGLVGGPSFIGSNQHRIVGIVESDVKYFVMDKLSSTYDMFRRFGLYTNVFPYSLNIFDNLPEVNKAEAAIYYTSKNSPSDKSVMIGGIDLNIAESIKFYSSLNDYPDYAENERSLLPFDKYYESLVLGSDGSDGKDTNGYAAMCSWIYEYYFEAFSDFIKQVQHVCYIDFYPWLLINNYSPEYLFLNISSGYFDFLPIDPKEAEEYFAGYVYKRDVGAYPETSEEAMQYLRSLYFTDSADENGDGNTSYADILAQKVDIELWDDFAAFDQTTNNNYYYFDDSFYVISDEDYIDLVYCFGESDNKILSYSDGLYSVDDDYPYAYMFIHTTNMEKTMSMLREYIDESRIITPDNYMSFLFQDSLPTIIANLTSFLSMLALLSLCVFFIMRTMTMNRIKEIGIYRAIGVTKKNMIFKFFIDVSVLTTLTVFIGYAVFSGVTFALGSNPALSGNFYFPIWLAILLYIFIYAVCALFGTLPVIILLRKTPSEILAKYDI